MQVPSEYYVFSTDSNILTSAPYTCVPCTEVCDMLDNPTHHNPGLCLGTKVTINAYKVLVGTWKKEAKLKINRRNFLQLVSVKWKKHVMRENIKINVIFFPGGTGFKSGPESAILTGDFVCFLSPSCRMSGLYLKIKSRPLSSLSFPIHYSLISISFDAM